LRTLHASLVSAYGAAVQKPAWLVEIVMTATYRYCSVDTVTWNSQSWTQADVDVSSLRVGAMEVSGSIVLGNADDAIGNLALTEGYADKRIRVWGYDATIASPALDVPVLVCDAVGAGVEVTETRVTINLRDSTEFLIAPRAIVAPEFGFTKLLQAGRSLTINGITFTIQRGR
jgi:hypothetical protein